MAQRVKSLEKGEGTLQPPLEWKALSLPDVMPLAEVMAPEVLAKELRVLWVLWEITRTLDMEVSHGEVYSRLLELVGRIVPYAYATLSLLDGSGRLQVVATVGRSIDLAEEIPFTAGMGISSWVVEKKSPLLIPSEPNFFKGVPQGVRGPRGVFRDSPLTSFLAVPLLRNGSILGVMAVAKDTGIYTQEDVRILQRLAGSICVVVDRLQREEQYRRLALVDELTGVYNRRYLFERLNQEVKRAERTLRPLTVVMLDLDGFKKLNDTLGHPAGDQALRWLAGLLRRGVRASDVVCRYGGDEFTVIMSETSLSSAVQVVERLRHLISERPPAFPRIGRRAKVTLRVSFGLAGHSPELPSGEALIAAADQALMQAKLAGGDCCRVASGMGALAKTS